MSKPANLDYRAAILGAFDRHTIRSLQEINEHLKGQEEYKSYQSTRRMLELMCKEGVLSQLPKRGPRNQVFYTKLIFNSNAVKLINPNGELVSLPLFLNALFDYEFPKVVDEKAAEAIKLWMLDALASVDPEKYVGKRDIPDYKELQRKLKKTLEMTGKLHAFIKNFLDSDVFSPVARSNLLLEFSEQAPIEHVMIVEKRY